MISKFVLWNGCDWMGSIKIERTMYLREKKMCKTIASESGIDIERIDQIIHIWAV